MAAARTVISSTSREYVIGDILGKGAYGEVRLVTEVSTNKKYAIKISVEHTLLTPDVILEISALKILSESRNIASIKDLIYEQGQMNPDIIMDLYVGNAKQYPPKTHDKLKNFAFDVLNGLLSLHNKSIYHLDLKPENILYNSEYERYYISDFGISIKVTEYVGIHKCDVQTAWYRAPEIMIANACEQKCKYNDTADLWSLGVILGTFSMQIDNPSWIHPITLAETRTRRRGRTVQEENRYLLYSVYRIFGKTSITPSLDTCTGFDLPEYPIVPVRETFHTMLDLEFDFMMQVLKLNPRERSSYRELFSHTLFNGFMASEPFDLTLLQKVKSMDTVSISLILDDAGMNTRANILSMIKDTVVKNRIFDLYFLALSIVDKYLEQYTSIFYDDLEVIAISAVIISSYTSNTPLNPYQFAREYFSIDEINNASTILLQMCEYNLNFSTEKDYLDAILSMEMSPTTINYFMKRVQIINLLISISYNPMFRAHDKETLVRAMIAYSTDKTNMEYSTIYYDFGLALE